MSELSYKDVIKHHETVETRLALLEVSLYFYNKQALERIEKALEKLEDKLSKK